MSTGNVGSKDAVALHGCLWVPSNGPKGTHDMALNPDVAAIEQAAGTQKESYTFTMNITTSTYRIVFHDGLYIVGDAVKDGEITDVSRTGWDGSTAKKLTYDDTEGCWKTEVQLEKGKHFRFANDLSMHDCYADNGVNPGDVNTAAEAARSSASDDDETQYANKLTWYNQLEDTHNDIPDPIAGGYGDVRFRLENGTYTVRFYAKSTTSGSTIEGDAYKVYYTIERPYKLYPMPDNKNATGTVLDGYTHFKTYSCHNAVQLPADVKMFYVSAVDNNSRVVTVKQLDKDFIPANTPVILAGKNPIPSTFAYYSNPWETVTLTDNQLKACYYTRHIAESEDGMFNYLFGYRKLEGDTKVTLGFYKPGTGDTQGYSAYLPTGQNITVGAKGYQFGFDETTAIDTIDHNGKDCAPYYTLQGMRIDRPGKGVYIHNGKKLIIR